MKSLQASTSFLLKKDVPLQNLKEGLITNLRQSFDIDHIAEGDKDFRITGATGGLYGIARHAKISLDINIVIENQPEGEVARIHLNGISKMATSLTITYSLLFLVLLIVGLLPGSIETDGEKSGAIDALIFLIFGIFIYADIHLKTAEPQDLLEKTLASMRHNFGHVTL